MTVISGNRCLSSEMSTTPISTSLCEGSPWISVPSKRMTPEAGFMRPQMVLSRVLLPWPFGPKIETSWLLSTRSDTSWMAWYSP